MIALRLLAGFLGLAVIGVEARHSFTGLRSIVSNLDDYAIGLVLLLAALWAPRAGGPAVRAGAFGIGAGFLFKIFTRRLEMVLEQASPRLDTLTCAAGGGLLLALVGLVASVREARRG